MSRILIVSNRVSLPGNAPERAGGLEVVLREMLNRHPCAWFGWSGKVGSGPAKAVRTDHEGHSFIVTDLSREDFDEYYNGFANRVLWPILHYRLDLAEYSLRDLGGYLRVNEHFADELDRHIRPGDLIWVHDYHLIPLARALRARGHRNKIGFFLHTPMPPPEVVGALPQHERLFPALAAFDLVGFQTETDCDNFARYLVNECRLPSRDLRSFLAGDRAVHLGVFPVSVNAGQVAGWAEAASQSKFVRSVADSLRERALVIGVDRLDYSKGIDRRIEAVGCFLDRSEAWRERFTFLQIAPRSRDQIPQYADMEERVSLAASRINARHGEANWMPIRYLNRAYSRRTLAGLYRRAKVGLVTPLRDGMNLVAMEFVCSQDPRDPGVLVLSRFAGAVTQCRGAILVNPYDAEGVAEALEQALTMPLAERRERHARSMREILRNDASTWGDRFIGELATADRELAAFAPAHFPDEPMPASDAAPKPQDAGALMEGDQRRPAA